MEQKQFSVKCRANPKLERTRALVCRAQIGLGFRQICLISRNLAVSPFDQHVYFLLCRGEALRAEADQFVRLFKQFQ